MKIYLTDQTGKLPEHLVRLQSKNIKPYKKESLEYYCLRLMNQIKDRKHLMLLGLSFGGIIAQEMAKHLKVEKLILLSSMKDRSGIRPALKFLGKIKPYRWLPDSVITSSGALISQQFGVKSDKGKSIIKAVVHDAVPDFVRWAMKVALQWKGVEANNAITIHGDADKVLAPPSPVDYLVQDGGHLIVMENAREVSEILLKIIRSEK